MLLQQEAPAIATQSKPWLLFGDTEGFSWENLRTNGRHRWCESGEILLFAHAELEGPITVEDFTAPDFVGISPKLRRAFLDPKCRLVFHNAGHDYTQIQHDPRIGAIAKAKPFSQYQCTMVQAMAHSLPGGLEILGSVLGLPEDKQKKKEGKKLIDLFCKPRPKNSKLRRATRDTHPDEWAQFVEYARQDIEPMRIIYRMLPRWNYEPHDVTAFPLEQCNPGQREFRLWVLDQKINQRGVRVDVNFSQAAIAAAEQEQASLAEDAKRITDDQVDSATKRDKVLLYLLKEHGLELPDLRSRTIEEYLERHTELPRQVRELLEVRLAASKTSARKHKRVLNGVSPDGFLRGLLQMYGALRTMRWAGRLFQPQNLPRVDRDDLRAWYFNKSRWELTDADKISDEQVIDFVKQQVQSIIDGTVKFVFPNVMTAVANTIRGVLIAPEDSNLVVADLSNIEGRGLVTLSGEEWKLEAFRAYDSDTGPDLYKVAYGAAFDCDPESINKDQRQIGKVMELALGYGGGVGAFLTLAITYALDISEMVAKAWETVPTWAKNAGARTLEWREKKSRERARKMLDNGKSAAEVHIWLQEALEEARYGLTVQEFICCDALKQMWRRRHPKTVTHWADLECAFKAVILAREDFVDGVRLIAEHKDRYPHSLLEWRLENGFKVTVGKYLEVDSQKSWVRIRLPSGTYLCYPQAQLDNFGKPVYKGINQYNRKWQRLHTYGGKLAENATQKFARDILAHNMPYVEGAFFVEGYGWIYGDDTDYPGERQRGFEIGLTVHDELITSAPRDPWYNQHELARMLSANPHWCLEIPLAADGFVTDRYHKE